ncbi:MAG: hypothetical protein V8T87_10880 [Victivallales bacterium]
MVEHIFSTDHTGGCKSLAYVWDFVIPRIGAPPKRISTVETIRRRMVFCPCLPARGERSSCGEKDEVSFPDSRMIPVENALQFWDFSKRRNETDGKRVSVGPRRGMSESSYGTATMECFKREKLGNYTVLFVGPWTPDKLRAIGEFCRKENMRFVMDR